MALPVLPKQKFRFVTSFLPKPIEFMPFTVGQQSIILGVKDSKDEGEKLRAIAQVLSECVLTEGINVSTLPVFVIEQLFLALRQRSVGEQVDFTYKCTHVEEGQTEKCNNTIDMTIDLGKIVLKEYKDTHSITVQITDTIGVKFRYPTIETISSLPVGFSEELLIVACIASVWDGDEVTHASDSTPEELLTFYRSMDLSTQHKIYKNVIASMPHVFLENNVTCSKCGTKHTVKFDSLSDFF